MHMLTTHVVDFIVDSASTPAVFGEQESESFYRISKHQFDTESNLQDKALEYSEPSECMSHVIQGIVHKH